MLLAAWPLLASAGPVKPVAQCGVPVSLVGGRTVLAEGATAQGRTDFSSRIEEFFRRACGKSPSFDVSAASGTGLLADLTEIVEKIESGGPRIWILHHPFSDIEGGAVVESLLAAYRRVLGACASSGSTCLIGGQQPVNGMDGARSAAQKELERRASSEFGKAYLPLYRHFESESSGRRLMMPMDSGDGRLLADRGHELLFVLFRNRLMDLGSEGRPAR